MDMKKVLAEAVEAAVRKAIEAGKLSQGEMAPVVLTVPPQKAFGDFATNFALQAARNFHCAPRVIAGAVQEFLECPSVEKVEVAGPGFLNFYLKEDWLGESLRSILEKGENYGNLPPKKGKRSRSNTSAPIPPVPSMWATDGVRLWAVPWPI